MNTPTPEEPTKNTHVCMKLDLPDGQKMTDPELVDRMRATLNEDKKHGEPGTWAGCTTATNSGSTVHYVNIFDGGSMDDDSKITTAGNQDLDFSAIRTTLQSEVDAAFANREEAEL